MPGHALTIPATVLGSWCTTEVLLATVAQALTDAGVADPQQRRVHEHLGELLAAHDAATALLARAGAIPSREGSSLMLLPEDSTAWPTPTRLAAYDLMAELARDPDGEDPTRHPRLWAAVWLLLRIPGQPWADGSLLAAYRHDGWHGVYSASLPFTDEQELLTEFAASIASGVAVPVGSIVELPPHLANLVVMAIRIAVYHRAEAAAR